MATVHIVTTGCYSAFSINEVYASRSDAEAAAALHPAYDDAEVHEYEVRERAPMRGWEQAATFWVSRPGDDGVWRAGVMETAVHDPSPCAVRIESFGDGSTPAGHTLTVTGTDRERVAKTFSHWRARILAQPWTTMTADEVRAAIDVVA